MLAGRAVQSGWPGCCTHGHTPRLEYFICTLAYYVGNPEVVTQRLNSYSTKAQAGGHRLPGAALGLDTGPINAGCAQLRVVVLVMWVGHLPVLRVRRFRTRTAQPLLVSLA